MSESKLIFLTIWLTIFTIVPGIAFLYILSMLKWEKRKYRDTLQEACEDIYRWEKRKYRDVYRMRSVSMPERPLDPEEQDPDCYAFGDVVDCPECKGKGYLYDDTHDHCFDCEGTGVVPYRR